MMFLFAAMVFNPKTMLACFDRQMEWEKQLIIAGKYQSM
jgi:hypothetical protein